MDIFGKKCLKTIALLIGIYLGTYKILISKCIAVDLPRLYDLCKKRFTQHGAC